MNLIKLQLGKKGLTQEFLENLKKMFITGTNARISLLKTSTRNKEETKKWADKMMVELGSNFTYKIIGYTITIKKWRKARE